MKLVSEFANAYPFPLDDFQTRAAEAISGGRSVLVCAPTGAGKTVVGEFGVWLALRRGRKAFYTTPLKALSNQKFGDFIARYGAERVGLLTGDNSINGEAPVVVMTTEVLRNMLYEGSPTLEGLDVVVMDEVHYLKDPYRGATWEEVLIHLPPSVKVAALSATVSNAREFGAWLATVRGATDVVVEEHRPVPIEHVYMAGSRLHPMFLREDDRLIPNPALRRLREPETRRRARGDRPGSRRREPEGVARGRVYIPDRAEVAERLRAEGMLPAIAFVFSRAGCDQAVRTCRAAGLSLTTPQERERVQEYMAMRTAALPAEDHEVLGFEEWADAIAHGIASHHAGLIPLFKETVEELFERALVKLVFATETLALGINMPAKTVVIERLVKFTGERHEMLTPADYTQLTGRAGRRGMDPVGYGITLLQRDVPFDRIAALAQAASYPLTSSFRPSYNIAVNLLRHHTVDEAKRFLDLSFAQFLADRGVARLREQIARNERFLEGYREHAVCERGDIDEYWGLARAAYRGAREEEERIRRDRTAGVRAGFEALRPGQVVAVGRGPRAGLAAVLEVRHGKSGEPHPVVLTATGKVVRLAVRDFREMPSVVGAVRIPRGDSRTGVFRNEVLRQLEHVTPEETRVSRGGGGDGGTPARAAESHPVAACPDRSEHDMWLRRIDDLERETAGLRKRVRSRTETLGRTFERVLAVLETFGYVADGAVTERGGRLARIYNESDLLVAEAIHAGVFEGLSAAELAAVVSAMVYETRIGVARPEYPSEAVRRAVRRLGRLFHGIHDAEESHRLELVREPDPGFVDQIHLWASGAALEDVLAQGDMPAGDFVRSTKQVWDLLRQLADLEPGSDLSVRCRESARAVYRGVVAYAGAL